MNGSLPAIPANHGGLAKPPASEMSPRKPAHEQRVPEFYARSCFAIRATALLSKDAKRVAAEPIALIEDQPVGKIAAGIEDRQSELDRRPVERQGLHRYRIFAGNVELGAAWQKTAKDTERDYLSVKLGRPELPGSDLRHPDRGGRPGRPPAHLVPSQPGLIPRRPAPPKRRGRFRVAAECECRRRSVKHRCASGHPRARMSPRKPAHEQRVPEFHVSSSVLRPCFAIRATAFLSKDANVSPPSQLPS